MLTFTHRDTFGWILRMAIVALALATAYIHYTLGGLMFFANAMAYAGFAVLMALPLSLASRCRWLIRAALIGFTTGTIVAWVMFGARYWLGYLDKGVELALIALLCAEVFRYDGGPLALAKRAWRLGVAGLHRLAGSALTILRLTLVLLLLGGCGTARTSSTPPPDAVIVSAAGDQFTDMPPWLDAGAPFTIYFEITDFSQHNLRLWNGETSIGATEIFAGMSARTLEVPALAPGYYELTCDIHPEMQGLLEAW